MANPDDQIEIMKTTDHEMTDEEILEFFDLFFPPIASNQQSKVPPTNDAIPLNGSLEVPSYLSSIDARAFVRMIERHAPLVDGPLNREDLRQMAILTHNLTMLELEQSLWTTYLKCGTSTLTPGIADQKLWPTSVINIFKELACVTNISDVDRIRATDHDCLEFVQRQLHNLENDERAFQCQSNQKKKQINDYGRIWEEPIRALVVEQAESSCQQFRCKIQLVEFDYRAHRLDRQFREESPSTAQMDRATILLDLKYQYETARQEVLLFKEQVAQNKLPRLFDALQGRAPHSFRSLSDTQLGQRLSDRQQAVLEYHRKEMIHLYLNTAEAKLGGFRTAFTEVMDNMQESQYMLPINDRFSPSMMHLLDQQLTLITEKLKCTYGSEIKQLTFQTSINCQ